MLAQNDEALTIFQNSLAAFLDKTAPPEAIERWNQNKQVDRQAWLAAGEFGMLGVLVPEEHGGLGMDFATSAQSWKPLPSAALRDGAYPYTT